MKPSSIMKYAIEYLLPDLGYTVYTDHLPEDDTLAVRVLDVRGGKLEERRLRTGVTEEHPAIHVTVRGNDIDEVYDTAQQISDMADTVCTLPIPSGEKLQIITKTNTIGSLGQEKQTRRCFCSQTFRLTITR